MSKTQLIYHIILEIMSKEKSREKMTIHHIVWKKHRKRANVEEKTNKMILSEFKHRAFNSVFQQAQSPQEQLEVMYDQYRKKVLSPQVCAEIEQLLSMSREEFYNEGLIKKKK